MANTGIEIAFISLPSDGDSITLKAHYKFANIPQERDIEIVFKTTPVQPNEVAIGAVVLDQAVKYHAKMQVIANDVFDITLNNDTVYFLIRPESPFDYFTEPDITWEGSQYTFIDTSGVLTFSGLESDRYLINNDIYIELSSGIQGNPYILTFQNLTTGISSSPNIVYGDLQGRVGLNIAPMIKSLFAYPSDAEGYSVNNQPVNNANAFKISVTSVNTNSVEITKTFIRGGKRTNDTNQTLNNGATCRPTYLLPIWNGYDTADYYLDENNIIRKRLLAEVPFAQKDFKRTKDCNAYYVKFANQQGGYCHWLFESHVNTHSNTAQGSFIRNNKVDDLGSESNSKLKIYSKVPEYYIDYINDLIDSPEVYVFVEGKYMRVTMANNSIQFDDIKRSYQVTLNINFEFRFYPSLLWQN